MSENVLKVKNLTGYNSEGYCVENVDFDLKVGEVHALLGESGSGKTVFVQGLTGAITNVEGEIIFDSEKIHLDHSANGINGIAFVQQKPSLVENFTVAENLSLIKYPQKGILPFINWSKVKKDARKLLDELNFELDYEEKIYNLSTEEKKLVAFAKIILQEPKVIIMHEPTNGLGAEAIRKLFKIICSYINNKGSIIYVTKQWEEVLKIADRITVLTKGKVAGTLLSTDAKKNPRKLLNMMLGNDRYDENEDQLDKESTKVLDAVFKAAEFLTSEYELKDVLLLLANQATKVMKADGCIINLIDESTNTIIDTVNYRNTENFEAHLKKKTILRIVKGKNLFYATERDKEFVSLFKKVNGVKTVICVPVLIRSQVTVCLQIFYQSFYIYSEKELMYLSTFARQAALAIEDTRLMGRSALLQESHHRIKNNLQSISSLISLQKDFIDKNPNKSIDNILNNIISRIKSIAAVHDLLSKDELGRSIINLKDIIQVILKFYNIDSRIEMNLALDDILIPYNKATAIALIINELVNNCFEHAFPETLSGTINIYCKQFEKEIFLLIEDNGVGLPEDFDLSKLQSLGLAIVYSMILNEFKGKMEFKTVEGTRLEIILPMEQGSLSYV